MHSHLFECSMAFFPLFRLPPELRNQIYECALHDSNGLLYERYNDGAGRLYTRPRRCSARGTFIKCLGQFLSCRSIRKQKEYNENNQLKYVCRRLYNETRGLGVYSNLIIIEDNVAMNALDQYTLLRRWAALRTVSIKCSLSTFASNLSFIKVSIPYWSQTGPDFIPCGIYFLSALRADSHSAARLAQTVLVSHFPGDNFEVSKTPLQVPSNLRFFPKEERFSRRRFEQNCLKGSMVKMPTTQAALRDLLGLVKGWFDHGL
ncbi:hypothetical protein GQ44DRAFT_433863 [Phaeosphaeriaceae sp. PMI808]|nr:hypothetical protein GQ44DRAFT_433863 [Phaeosphaeriaceae sp. PMI808]